MADIYGSHFEYAGVSSRKYGLIIANVESSRYTAMSGPISTVSIYNKSNQRRYIVDTDYQDSMLSFEIDIVTDDERTLEPGERRSIERWLFNQRNYCKLYMDMVDDTDGETFEIINGEQKRLYLRCRFLNPEKLEYNGGLVGYRVTLEADSVMWWQDAVTYQATLANPNDTSFNFKIEVDSDVIDYTYPIITLTTKDTLGDGDLVVIRNQAYQGAGEGCTLSNMPAGATLTMNSELNLIYGGQYYRNLFNQSFTKLVNGTNHLYCFGISSITVTFQNRRRF